MEECLKEKELKERADEKEWMNEEQMKEEGTQQMLNPETH